MLKAGFQIIVPVARIVSVACFSVLFCDEEEREKIERKHRFWVRPIYGSSVLIILRKFVIKTFIPLYFFHKCRGVIRVACRHLKRVYGREVSNQVHHGICPDASVASIV